MSAPHVKIARAALAGGAMLALGACNLAPKYVRPDLPVAPSLPQGTSYPTLADGAGGVDAIGWQAFFTDQQLKDTIALALSSNRDLRSAVAAVAQARATYKVDRAALVPTVTAGPIASGSRSNGVTSESYQLSGGVSSYEVDLFGKLRNTSRAAFEAYLASDEGRKATQITLVSETATAWLTLAADRDALAVAQATLASRTKTLQLTQQLETNGVGTKLAVAQAQTAFDTARADVADYTTYVAQDRNALELLTGAPVPEALLPKTLGEGRQTLASLPVGLSSDVLLRRPDVLQAEHTLKEANARIGAARAAFFPSISLTGLLGLASTSLSGLFSGGTFAWSASGSATQTLFDGGVNAGNLAYAKASRDAAVASYEKAIQTAFREVADALARRGTIDDKVAAQESYAANAEKAAQITLARYQNGIDTFLEPLDADRTAYTARQALVTARLARATNMVTLYEVLGGGLTP
ncbi:MULTISPECIES: efflux transporter outer membrane subunit [unclassified Novosphingobium]|uniref:efflux transporter outer membrane subunit n=1 Tax=unclassified Novosphingobium TaxID=2644732 RepID=UPI00146C0C00|nr:MULTISPECIES: efflux transporter outer membrane subunit [unclassified Novosphingobium]NMN03566.1 multidrug efflux system outer membrane protein [Novosphingobium sp. SG919]NMN86444.1 multidrug efflux system outer membrane protein [Novosphingobium sp. SG916]